MEMLIIILTCMQQLLQLTMPGFDEPTCIHYPWTWAWLIAQKSYHLYMVICGNFVNGGWWTGNHDVTVSGDSWQTIWYQQRLFAKDSHQAQQHIIASHDSTTSFLYHASTLKDCNGRGILHLAIMHEMMISSRQYQIFPMLINGCCRQQQLFST